MSKHYKKLLKKHKIKKKKEVCLNVDIVLIIQARMGSSRLPNKMMRKLSKPFSY